MHTIYHASKINHRKLKIILTVTNDLHYDQRMQRICTSLANKGYEVKLVGRLRASSFALQDFTFQTKRLSCFFDKGKFFYLEYNIRLFLYLLFSKFDVVCSIDLDTILAGFYVAKWKRKTCVYDAHEYFTEVPEVVERPAIQRIWERIANLTIPRLKHCYTVCESLSEVFEEKYGTPFQVIRNVPFALQRPILLSEIQRVQAQYNLPQTDKKVILYQGALNDGRGIEELITVMQFIDSAELWLAGEGDLSQDLRTLAQQLKVTNRVHFLGFVLPNDLKAITQLADIGLNLLQNKGLNYYYSLANKCFDYVQAEKPALQMDFPEYQKINERYEIGILLPDLAVHTIQTALEKLLNEPDFYQKIVQNCKTAKVEWTWENESLKLLDFYKKLE